MKKSIALSYKENGSDKVYQATLEPKEDGFVVNIAYGGRGKSLTTGTKTNAPVDLASAQKIFDKVVREKKSKGYVEEGEGILYQHNPDKVFTGILPQLLNSIDNDEVEKYIDDDDYIAQEKHDGERMLFSRTSGVFMAINKKGMERAYPTHLMQAFEQMDNFLVDGEIVGETYRLFDLLIIEGKSLKERSYSRRMYDLIDTFVETPKVQITHTAETKEEKQKLIQTLKESNAEGVVFKHINSSYVPGRPNSGGPQLKHKFYATASFVVWKINDQRSVLLFLLNDDKNKTTKDNWIEAGNCTIPPNHEVPSLGSVVEVRYLYAYRASGSVFQPTYLGVRNDVAADECLTSQLKYKRENE